MKSKSMKNPLRKEKGKLIGTLWTLIYKTIIIKKIKVKQDWMKKSKKAKKRDPKMPLP